uniref:uncharacterized protein LOC122593385 isoform X2 n=1 Tax=Erigeron canadensis TaxID=72917 RepID=UPI001CB98EC6|nr:uncharacterized protein LOC122593385 isoform X2 [Erigeron canadensis]
MANGGFGLEYWLQWQVFVCALIIIIPSLVFIKFIKNTPTTNYYHLWLPCWRNLHPRWLFLYRLFAFLSMAYLLYLILAAFGPFVFFFYTQWTFLLVTIYFALGSVISAHGCWKQFRERSLSKMDSSSVEVSKINEEAGFWGNAMQNIYQACAGASLLTDLVFWGLLLPFQTGDTFKLTLLIGCMHSVNAVFLVLDSALNSLQFSWHGLRYFIFWSSAYIVFQWIMHMCCFSWWPYPFLELATPWAPMWYFGW